MSGDRPNRYVVQQGDHMSRIADMFGFSHYSAIWDHANNAQLKSLRANPNILLAGDALFIPDLERKEQAGCATGKRHTFRLKAPKLRLVLVLQNEEAKPVEELPCVMHVEGRSFKATTELGGQIGRSIRPSDRHARLDVTAPDSQFGTQIPIRIGDLDPVGTRSGQVARLTNLAYFLGDPEKPSDADFKSAVEEFQCDHPPLRIDGVCGQATQDKLREVHGS